MPNAQEITCTRSLFLSYSHLDAERVAPYRIEFDHQSIPYWYDKALHAGGNFNDEIAHNIDICDAFVLFLSTNSAASWYIADELTYARNNKKRVVVIHLDREIDMPSGMKLLLGNLHHLFDYDLGIDGCVDGIARALNDGTAKPAEPIREGKLNHNSDLLVRCRQSFEHFASQIGVRNLEEGIDPNLFCSIHATKGKDKDTDVDLYGEICSEDHTHILLQADGGLGKTYTFLSAMKRLLTCDRPCAYIPCHLFMGTAGQKLGLILDMLCVTYLDPKNRSEAELNDYFKQQTDKAFILFLDGYNEAVAKEQLSSEIIHLSSMFPNIKIVVSSRYNDSIFVNYDHYMMKGLSRDKVRAVLSAYGRNYENLTDSLQMLLLTPMFLRLFVQMGQNLDREIDTAAELMDQARRRVLNIVRQGNPSEYIKNVEFWLNQVFPEFVRHEYCTNNRGLSFSGKRLKEYLKQYTQELSVQEDVIQFLLEYSIIHEGDERTNSYAYQHEHYRDYWVAYAVFHELLKCVEDYSGSARAEALIEAIDENYSQTVFRFVGELAQVDIRGKLLDVVADSLRRGAVQDDTLWLSDRNAKATAKLIEIYKIVLDGNLIGFDLSGLNLSAVQLNQARTCTRNRKASFRESLIDERTFVVSMHESAPRRVEILRLDDKCYLVSISNHDLLISTLPELDNVWRYPHLSADGASISTHALTTSVTLGACILAVDSNGCVWEWDFILEDGVPSVSPVRRHDEAKPALKVFPWSDDEGPLIALQRIDGTIMQYAENEVQGTNETVLLPEAEYRIDAVAMVNTRKTMTSSHLHTFLCWAIATEDAIQVWRHDIVEQTSEVICSIPDKDVTPDYMICMGSEQSSRDSNRLRFGASEKDGTILILTAINKKYTNLYQINLSNGGATGATYAKLEWSDVKSALENQYKKTQRQYNRINAMSFANNKMLLAASDGCIYQYSFDELSYRFIPDAVTPWVRLAASTFSVEDVLYVPMSTSMEGLFGQQNRGIEIAAVSGDRSVHLMEIDTLFPKKKLRGYNDGLRYLLPISDSLVRVTSYDGCVIELQCSGDRMQCRDKLPVGNWCWALERIGTSVYAAGYMSGLVLIDIQQDKILCRIDGFGQKVEHLLYMPDIENALISVSQDAVRVYSVQERNGRILLEDKGTLSLPKGSAGYWSMRSGDTLFISINGENESNPCIAHFNLSKPLIGQAPELIKTPAKFGRIRDIHLLDDKLMLSGLCGEDGDAKSSQVCFLDISNMDTPVVSKMIEGFQSFIVHSTVYQLSEGAWRGAWRVATIDAQDNGKLYQYVVQEDLNGSLSAELVSTHVFPAKLCDVAFDSKGDLMLTCLNGYLYGKQWIGDAVDKLFRNKCYMLTFGTDMSGLYNPIDPKSQLGEVLTDFGNGLEKTRRGKRVIRR